MRKTRVSGEEPDGDHVPRPVEKSIAPEENADIVPVKRTASVVSGLKPEQVPNPPPVPCSIVRTRFDDSVLVLVAPVA